MSYSTALWPSLSANHGAMLVSTVVFTLLYIGLVTLRYGLAVAEDARDEAPDAA